MTLETAKALKEAGWGQFHYRFYHDTKLRKIAWSGDIQLAPVDFGDRYIANPSLEELLAVMRDVFLWKTKLCYHAQLNGKPETECMSNNPTEAVAQLWLKLRKEGIV